MCVKDSSESLKGLFSLSGDGVTRYKSSAYVRCSSDHSNPDEYNSLTFRPSQFPDSVECSFKHYVKGYGSLGSIINISDV